MTSPTITRLAMAVAGTMLAHQIASKAVREAMFLSGPGIERFPAMTMVTSLAVVMAVPVYSRLMASWGPRRLVPAGFALSAVAHLIEWRLPPNSDWVAALVFLHVAGFGALLLSGFWSLLSEIFDPRSAKDSYGPIAAAGTVGGLAGGAALLVTPVEASLLVLAVLHAGCAAGIWWIGRHAPLSSLVDRATPRPRRRLFDWSALRRTPYIATLATLVALSSAGAFIVDYLFKLGVTDWFNQGVDDPRSIRPGMQQFFALFYMGTGLLMFAAQGGAGAVVRRIGLGRTMATLPAGLGLTGAVALAASVWTTAIPSFVTVAIARATEAVVRGSWFRSGYELLFVPMAPEDKRRTKTFLDVTCDRAGDAIGAAIAQRVAWAAISFPAFLPWQSTTMLTVTLAMAATGLWLSRRIDRLYLGVVAGRLADQADNEPVVVQSETGWTLLELPSALKTARTGVERPASAVRSEPLAAVDPRLRNIADLRSGDRARVEAALRHLKRPDRSEVAHIMQLLAWDDLAPLVRHTLERIADVHVGLFEDALRDHETDFAIRRRIPRILATVPSERALGALLAGLDDPRFEVRFQCVRAISQLLARAETLAVSRDRIMAAVERELSVPLRVWEGHGLLDQEAGEETDWQDPQHGTTHRNLEHVFSLLALVLPKEPLKAAFRGIQSDDPELRALTLEYFENTLPTPIVVRLWSLPDFVGLKSSSGDAP